MVFIKRISSGILIYIIASIVTAIIVMVSFAAPVDAHNLPIIKGGKSSVDIIAETKNLRILGFINILFALVLVLLCKKIPMSKSTKRSFAICSFLFTVIGFVLVAKAPDLVSFLTFFI